MAMTPLGRVIQGRSAEEEGKNQFAPQVQGEVVKVEAEVTVTGSAGRCRVHGVGVKHSLAQAPEGGVPPSPTPIG